MRHCKRFATLDASFSCSRIIISLVGVPGANMALLGPFLLVSVHFLVPWERRQSQAHLFDDRLNFPGFVLLELPIA